MKKQFECKGKCDLKLEMIIYSCKKCIKRTVIYPNKKQTEAINKILKRV
jgi:hypothetical protein